MNETLHFMESFASINNFFKLTEDEKLQFIICKLALSELLTGNFHFVCIVV